ncbi:dynamin family protein [Roseospira marina]|uniref:dynamin family protein n=1 Tax=Roseospira marina TaxID=140057 RepID=UPI0017AC4E71|nr:dynamin family protein [Roseospira marina]MBB4312697.1 hypothetical protein [Roseospira marina]MBB5086530.1 hypothetical protein [Roseospira marina]
MTTRTSLRHRLRTLEAHLKTEHPDLVQLMPLFRRVDRVLYRSGLLDRSESLAARIPWWPMISVLGTFSAGKSTFINSHLGANIQSTGNQAVDDKFTVICYGDSADYRVLPGTALNADPRFPFFRISDEIEKVAPGEGKRIDAYLQLKTVGSAQAKGVIVIDSPGFDSDDQRRSTLRITDHIIDLSDLVLIFFDARHPEPGAMQDTLQHLVSKTVRRADPTKFLYVLNQIDTTAKEDNATEVVGAWQRAIAQAGLVSGRFYAIYNKGAAVEIASADLRERYEAKRDHDLREILGRIAEIGVGRSYRVVAMLETVINELETELMPALSRQLARWRRRVLIADVVWGALMLGGVGAVVGLAGTGVFDSLWAWIVGTAPAVTEAAGTAATVAPEAPPAGGALAPAVPEATTETATQILDTALAWSQVAVTWLGDVLSGLGQGAAAVAVRVVAVVLAVWAVFQIGHQTARSVFAKRLAPELPEIMGSANLRVQDAFRRNTGFGVGVFRTHPVGWTSRAKRRLQAIRETAMAEVQRLNDQYTDPSGRKRQAAATAMEVSAPDAAPVGAPSGRSAFAPPPPDPLAVPAETSRTS